MAQTTDGSSQSELQGPEAEDPDSIGKTGFFARLFRRDSDGEDAGQTSPGDALAGNDKLVNLRNLHSMRVEDVSVPRADIVAVSQHAPLEDVVAAFQKSTLSRLPVYSEALDEPLGLIHLKDLALQFGFGVREADFDLRSLLRPLLYAPPSMRLGVLLQKMQAARIHMALIIDEYGGVDGLVTLEDVLEQVVGDISDEHDEDASQLWTVETPGVYTCQARVDLQEFEAAAGVSLVAPELSEEVDTLGGLVFRLAGRVPARGEVVMHPDGHEFEVIDADPRRVKRLRVRLKPETGRDDRSETARAAE